MLAPSIETSVFNATCVERLQLDRIARLSPDLAAQEAAPALAHLISDKTLLDLCDLPLAPRANNKEPYIAHRWETEDGSCAVQLFVWLPGASSQIHDHSCWGAICSAFGPLAEERYNRVDDGEQPNSARLKSAWKRLWLPGEGISTLLPYNGGIHKVSNPGDHTVLSLHLYGPPGIIDGRDYDPRRDYVCDRLVGD